MNTKKLFKSNPFKTVLTQRNYKAKEYTVYAVDMEYTRAEGAFLEGCIGDEEQQSFYLTMDDFLDGLFLYGATAKQVRFVVHAGRIAEFVHLIKHIRTTCPDRYDLKPICSGDQFISLELQRGEEKVTLCDLFALLPSSLAKLTEKFAPEYVKLKTVDFEKRDYEQIADRAYLGRDVAGTAHVYKEFDRIVQENFGVQVSLSAAGTAMRAFLQQLDPKARYVRRGKRVEEFCRHAYYGGYVGPGYDNNIHENVVSWDMTAAYGYQMSTQFFPTGRSYVTTELEEGLGIYRCAVTNDSSELPICPYRVETDFGVYWLRMGDSCETYITNIEIAHLRAHGHTVHIYEGVVWQQQEQVFAPFMEKVYQIEKQGGVLKDAAKLMRNSLYGKFAMKSEQKSYICTAHPTEGYAPYIDPCTGAVVPDVYEKDEVLEEAYIHPEWAAFITAYQRVALQNYIYQIGFENCYGYDTDSIKVPKDIALAHNLPMSETLWGHGKFEAEYALYRSHGPKNYVGVKDGTHSIKLKGIPKKALTQELMHEHLYRTTESTRIDFVSITNSTAMLKANGQLPYFHATHRSMNSIHSEKWLLENGRFYPVYNPNNLKGEQAHVDQH